MAGEPQTSERDYSHIAFNVEDFNGLTERLLAAGAPLWQHNQSEGKSMYFCDPSANRLEIHATTLRMPPFSPCYPWDRLEILRPDIAGT